MPSESDQRFVDPDPTWPYDDTDLAERLPLLPTWACPTGACECDGHALEVPVEHRLHFFDQFGNRMGRARARLFDNGRLVNASAPNALVDASLPIEVRKSTRTLFVEWAPANLPIGPPYPFRRHYFVDMGSSSRSRVSRRLHNIGFSGYFTLAANVKDFQDQYVDDGSPHDGEASRIYGLLGACHDDALLPPVGTRVPSSVLVSLHPPPAGRQSRGCVKTQFYMPLREGCGGVHCDH